jgi:predicted RNA-binding Zn ribbon-like protein
MQFNTYTWAGAYIAVWLVNHPSPEPSALAQILHDHDVHEPTATTGQARALRPWAQQLRDIFEADTVTRKARLADRLLVASRCHPRLISHGPGLPFHLHYAPIRAGLIPRVKALTAAGLAHAIDDEAGARLRACARAGCGTVFIDTSRNARRHYCTVRCANQVNVANHRRRRRQAAGPLTSSGSAGQPAVAGLEPASFRGDADRVHPVASVELGDRRGEVVAYRAVRQAQLRGDPSGPAPVANRRSTSASRGASGLLGNLQGAERHGTWPGVPDITTLDSRTAISRHSTVNASTAAGRRASSATLASTAATRAGTGSVSLGGGHISATHLQAADGAMRFTIALAGVPEQWLTRAPATTCRTHEQIVRRTLTAGRAGGQYLPVASTETGDSDDAAGVMRCSRLAPRRGRRHRLRLLRHALRQRMAARQYQVPGRQPAGRLSGFTAQWRPLTPQQSAPEENASL